MLKFLKNVDVNMKDESVEAVDDFTAELGELLGFVWVSYPGHRRLTEQVVSTTISVLKTTNYTTCHRRHADGPTPSEYHPLYWGLP